MEDAFKSLLYPSFQDLFKDYEVTFARREYQEKNRIPQQMPLFLQHCIDGYSRRHRAFGNLIRLTIHRKLNETIKTQKRKKYLYLRLWFHSGASHNLSRTERLRAVSVTSSTPSLIRDKKSLIVIYIIYNLIIKLLQIRLYNLKYVKLRWPQNKSLQAFQCLAFEYRPSPFLSSLTCLLNLSFSPFIVLQDFLK